MQSRKQGKNSPHKQHKKGRICKKYGCKQRLSIYNSNELCNTHKKRMARLMDTAAVSETEIEPSPQEVASKKTKPPVPLCQQGDVPIANMLPNADNNAFCLIRMAMIRALDIDEGSKPLIEHDPSDKPTSIALQEIAQGKVVYQK